MTRVGRGAVFQTVVVGTDGSATAQLAVAQAVELVKDGSAVLHIVSAYRSAAPQIVESGGEHWRVMPKDHVDNVLQEAAARARMAGAQVETHAATEDPADAIIRLAEEVKADLVVVGNKGMTGAKRFLLGSVPNKVAHHAPCAVLVVKTT
jgi:nucleotide-binding universal stress UspA family protein